MSFRNIKNIKMSYLKFFGLWIIVILFACKSNKEVSVITPTGKPAIVTFQDSIQASEAIISDDIDGFFDQLSVVEMQIQMKSNQQFKSREEALSLYKNFIKTQVSDWETEEKLALEHIFRKVKIMCDTLSPRIFPGGMKLIKIKTGPYGNDVYYTRGSNILIPENIFPLQEPEYQFPVMLHEVFHILSRYNPDLRKDLYALIGFSKSDKPVKLNSALEKILLTNPDGVSYQYTIALDDNGKKVQAIPLITSRYDHFKPEQPKFFDYLNFDLYNLDDRGDHYVAKSTTKGQSLMPLSNTPAFFTKIKDNTQYIIHPDEIMADNFMLALQAYSKNAYGKFSKEGRILIDQVIDRLKQM